MVAVIEECGSFSSAILPTIIAGGGSAGQTDGKVTFCFICPTPIVLSARDTTICTSETIDLKTLLTGSHLHTLYYGTAFGNYNLGQTSSQLVNNTTTFFIIDSIGTDCKDTTMLTVTVIPQPDIMGKDTSICLGQTVDLSTLINGTPVNQLEFGTTYGTYGLAASQMPTTNTTFFVRDSNTTIRCLDSAKIVVTVESQPNITARDTITMLGQTIDLSSLLNEGVTGSLDFGLTLGNYGITNPVSAQDTLYIIRDSVQNAVGCVDTAKVRIITPIPSTSLVDSDGDNQPDIADPCSCFDPENVVVENGANRSVTLFHDFVTITNGGIGQTWVLDVVNSGDVLMENGNPIPISTPLTDLGGGVYRLDLWHQPNIGINATFRRVSDNNLQTTGGSCGGQACLTVPTMSEWGLLIFGLLVLNLGIFFVQRLGFA